jgi:hypothetical protein
VIDVRVGHADGEVIVSSERGFTERADLYPLIADAFRAVHQRIVPKPTRKTGRLASRALRHARG